MSTVTFMKTMDPHAEDVILEDRCIGSAQWHKDRDPCFVVRHPLTVVPLQVLECVVGKLHAKLKTRR